MNTDTPLPPDEPMGENPPDGAIIDYSLKSPSSGPVTLEFLDAAGELVRRYASTDRLEPPDPATAPVPLYWYRPPHVLSAEAGMHRFVWDLHHEPVPGARGRGGLPIAAIPHNTAPNPAAPWVMPGQYTVRLTAGGRSTTQPLTVRMDPRVKTTPMGLQQQFTLSRQLYDAIGDAQQLLAEIRAARTRLSDQQTADERAGAVENELTTLNGQLNALAGQLESADVAPTTPQAMAVRERRQALTKLKADWAALAR